MVLDKKNYYLVILFLLILVNIALRLPITSHQIGWDSYRTHELSKLISDNKQISYNLNPLSIFGLYPYSYASGIPLILTQLSLITGISIESIIWFFAIFTAIISLLLMISLTKKINNNNLFVFLTIFTFTTSLVFVYLTTWTASTRALFIAVFPLFIYLLIDLKEKFTIKKLILLLAILFLLVTIHHLFIFSIAIFIAFLITYLFTSKIQKIKTNKKLLLIEVVLLILSIALFLIPFFITVFNFNITIQNTSDIYKFILRYARDIGLLGIFWPIGFIYLLFKKIKTFYEWFFIFMMITLIPFLNIVVYIPALAIPIISILISYGIIFIISLFKKRIIQNLALSFLVISTLFVSALFQVWHPNIIQDRDNYNTRFMSKQDENLALWLQDKTYGNVIGNDRILLSRIATLYPCKVIGRDIAALSCGYLSESDIQTKFKSPLDYTFWSDYPLVLKNEEFRYEVSTKMKWFNYYDKEAAEFLGNYDISYFISNKEIVTGKENLFKSTRNDKNKVYDNGINEVWNL